jgi:hypothetical protein
MTIESLRSYIELKKKQIEDLERLHGTGVRSSAIGEDIGILCFYLRDAEDQLAELEKNNATD